MNHHLADHVLPHIAPFLETLEIVGIRSNRELMVLLSGSFLTREQVCMLRVLKVPQLTLTFDVAVKLKSLPLVHLHVGQIGQGFDKRVACFDRLKTLDVRAQRADLGCLSDANVSHCLRTLYVEEVSTLEHIGHLCKLVSECATLTLIDFGMAHELLGSLAFWDDADNQQWVMRFLEAQIKTKRRESREREPMSAQKQAEFQTLLTALAPFPAAAAHWYDHVPPSPSPVLPAVAQSEMIELEAMEAVLERMKKNHGWMNETADAAVDATTDVFPQLRMLDASGTLYLEQLQMGSRFSDYFTLSRLFRLTAARNCRVHLRLLQSVEGALQMLVRLRGRPSLREVSIGMDNLDVVVPKLRDVMAIFNEEPHGCHKEMALCFRLSDAQFKSCTTAEIAAMYESERHCRVNFMVRCSSASTMSV